MKHLSSLILSGALLSIDIAGTGYSQNASPQQPPAANSQSETSAEPAAPSDRRNRGTLARLDKNNDGVIQKDEFTRADRLRTADTLN